MGVVDCFEILLTEIVSPGLDGLSESVAHKSNL